MGSVPGVTAVKVTMGEMTAEEKAALMARARWKARENPAPATEIPPTARVVAIASGKGGVGKSSVTANLAAALAARGLHRRRARRRHRRLLDPPHARRRAARVQAEDKKIVPIEKPVGAGLLKVVSMGSIEGAEEDEAIMLRGLMLNRAVQHFLEDVRWGDLDYLLIDMPPGTATSRWAWPGCCPAPRCSSSPRRPWRPQKVAARAADMARKGYLRVAGVIENMTAFVVRPRRVVPAVRRGRRPAAGRPDRRAAARVDPARPGGRGRRRQRRARGARGDGPAADAFRALADRIVTEAIPPVEMATCTARLLDTSRPRSAPSNSFFGPRAPVRPDEDRTERSVGDAEGDGGLDPAAWLAGPAVARTTRPGRRRGRWRGWPTAPRRPSCPRRTSRCSTAAGSSR